MPRSSPRCLARTLPTLAAHQRGRGELAEDGYEQAITVALSPTEQDPFLDAGFVLQERLHLLVHDLAAVPPRTTTEAASRSP